MLRFLVMPFLLSTFLFTAYFHDYRVRNNEWMALSNTPRKNSSWYYADLNILDLKNGKYRVLPTQPNVAIQKVSSDSKWLYFHAIAEHQYEGDHIAQDIYRLRIDNFTVIENLTHDEFSDDSLSALSSDGEWMYYSSEKAYATPAEQLEINVYRDWVSKSYWWEMFRSQADGSDKQRLTISPNLNNWFLGFASNNQDILLGIYTSPYHGMRTTSLPRQGMLYVTSNDGLFRYPVAPDDEFSWIEVLGFSPDKEWVYCYTQYPKKDTSIGPRYAEFQRLSLDGTNTKQILYSHTDPYERTDFIDYSPSNNKIYFRTYSYIRSFDDLNEALSNLYSFSLDNPNTQAIEISSNVLVWNMTPDNQWLYYAQDGNQIYRLNTDNQTLEYLTELNTYNYFLSFSLDGDWIYFRSVEGETAYLYKMRLDGSGLQQLADITALDMCVYPDRCQDNLFVVADFGMKWHPYRMTYGSGLLLIIWLGVEIMQRRKRHSIMAEFT